MTLRHELGPIVVGGASTARAVPAYQHSVEAWPHQTQAVPLVQFCCAGLQPSPAWQKRSFCQGKQTEPLSQSCETVQPDAQTLLVLDFENNPTGPSMNLEEARAFVTHVQQATGRWPGLYSGHYVKDLLGSNLDSILANCWFWLAQYGPTPVIPANWKNWTMWQYTDGAVGNPPHEVAGIGRCDRDIFAGDEAALRQFWSPAGRQGEQETAPTT